MIDALRKIKIKAKDLIFIIVTLLALILFGILLANQFSRLSLAREELAQEKEFTEELVAQKGFIIELEADHDKYIREYDTLKNMMPNEDENVEMLNYLQSIFIKYNLAVNGISFGEKFEKDDYSEIPLQISLNGEYNQIIAFIEDFRFGDRVFRVDKFYMNRQGDTDSKINCDLISWTFFRTSQD